MMRQLKSILSIVPELCRTLLKERITVGYPFAPMELPDYFRGKIEIDPALCQGCGLCVRDCPALALELERQQDRFRLVLHHDRCAYCGQCEQGCHYGAIQLRAKFEAAAPDREDLVQVLVDKERIRRKKGDDKTSQAT